MAMARQSPPSHHASPRPPASCAVVRPALLSVAKLVVLGMMNLPGLRAAPTMFYPFATSQEKDLPMPAHSPTLWIYLAVAVGLVLLGGAFAGLTIALMGQVKLSHIYNTQLPLIGV